MKGIFFEMLGKASLIAGLALLFLPPGGRAASTVVAWGDNSYGQTNVPAGLGNVVAIAGGMYHDLALRDDGTVVAWGGNDFGQTNVPTDLSNVVAIAGGRGHSLALRVDGTVVAWGWNSFGQTNVPAALSNLVSIAAGFRHSLGLRADGTVVAWGDNLLGQTNVPPELHNVVAIACGFDHSLALRANGTVVAWGMYSGLEYWYPIAVPAGLSNVVAIAAGGQQSVALRADGTVSSWFGGGSLFSPGFSNVVAIAAGECHTLALGRDGTVAAPGGITVPAGLSNVLAVAAAGCGHSLALIGGGPPIPNTLLTDRLVAQEVGTVMFYAPAVGDWPLGYQWQFNGTNLLGATNAWLILTNVLPSQAGLYSVTVSNSLESVTSPGSRLTVVAAIFNQPPEDQVVYLGGTVRPDVQVQGIEPLRYQWRFNGSDLAGETNAALVLQNVRWSQEGWYSVLVSNRSGSVLSQDARLAIVNIAGWGNDYELSSGSLLYRGQATPPGGLTNVVAVAGGDVHSLALRVDGTVVAWGDNAYGQTDVPISLSNVVAIAAGYYHSLALRADGTVLAWGLNNNGQTNLPAGLGNVVAIASGGYHNLALRADGTVTAWGNDGPGQTGFARLSNVVAVAAGAAHSLVLRADGTVVAWPDPSSVPTGLRDVVAIASGYQHSLALRADGTVAAWGANFLGQSTVPTGLSNIVAIAGGGFHSLALRVDGTVTAWGYNDFGQTNVPADVSNVAAIAGGGRHSLALVGENPPMLTLVLANPRRSGPNFSLSLPTQSGRVYALEFKYSLDDSNWSALPLVAGNGVLLTLTDPSATTAQRFYRVCQW